MTNEREISPEDGKKLAEEFNEFLKTAKVDKLLRKWKASSTADLTVDQNINFPEGKTLKVAFNLGNKVLSFKEHGEIKGLEIELIYEFLKEKKYNVIFEEISFEDMVEYIKLEKLISLEDVSQLQRKEKIMFFFQTLSIQQKQFLPQELIN